MTEKSKDLATFAALFMASLALAGGAMLWLGADGRVPIDMAADGTVTRSGSVLVLWLVPALILAVWGLGAPGAIWLSRVLAQSRAVEGAEDTTRGFLRYRRALRAYAAGFTLLAVGLQAFTLVRAAGVARPLGLDRESLVRLFFVLGGLMFVAIGNVSPKVPYAPSPAIDATRHHKAHRFFGWVFVLGGVAYCVVAVAAPFDRLGTVTWPIALSMILLPLLRYAMLVIEQRRETSRNGCDPA